MPKKRWRPKIVYDESFFVIATFEDLREALDLMNRVGSSVRPYHMDWFKKRFIPSYETRLRPNEERRVGKNGEEYVIKERRQGLSTKQLVDDMKEEGESISTEDLRHRYLYPLLDQGLIDSVHSVIDGRQSIYFPTGNDEIDINSLFGGDGPELTVGPSSYPTPERVQESFEKMWRCGDVDR